MRALIIVILVVLGIIFVGGGINVGGAPIFHHIDSVLRTHFFMSVHYRTFYFLYRGEHSVGEGLSRTQSDVREFEKHPAGIDNRAIRERLDEAGK